MNCWEILGIEPTSSRERIDQAYEQQSKFAAGEDRNSLERAYREALAAAGEEVPASAGIADSEPRPGRGQTISPDAYTSTLSAADRQVVRETVIQIQAMLNDTGRRRDVSIWRAILAEPPADREPLRAAIGHELKPEVMPLIDNAELSLEVARFLGDWFQWESVSSRLKIPADTDENEPGAGQGTTDDAETPAEKPQLVNFWPAVLGWLVGLIILTSLFGGMTGGGG